MKQQDLEDEKYELDNLADKQAALLAEEEVSYRILMKDYEYAKDREAILMGDRWENCRIAQLLLCLSASILTCVLLCLSVYLCFCFMWLFHHPLYIMLYYLRATLDLNLRHINLEKKNTHDIHSRKVREKDKELRNLKKAELQLKVAQDNLTHTQMMYERAKGNVSSV